jgi:hypothetical protein
VNALMVGMIVFGSVGGNQVWIVFVVVGAALIPVVYSYIVYRGLEGFGPDPEINDDIDLDT